MECAAEYLPLLPLRLLNDFDHILVHVMAVEPVDTDLKDARCSSAACTACTACPHSPSIRLPPSCCQSPPPLDARPHAPPAQSPNCQSKPKCRSHPTPKPQRTLARTPRSFRAWITFLRAVSFSPAATESSKSMTYGARVHLKSGTTAPLSTNALPSGHDIRL